MTQEVVRVLDQIQNFLEESIVGVNDVPLLLITNKEEPIAPKRRFGSK